MQKGTAEIDAKFRTMLILWSVLLMSQFMLLGVLFTISPDIFTPAADAPPLGDEPVVVIAFAALAVINLAMSFFMRRRSIQQAIAERKPAYVQTGVILGSAFCESISLLGMVLAIAFGYQYFYAWFALGIIGIFLHFPRRSELLDAAYGPSGTA